MKKIKTPVLFATFYLLAYQVLPFVGGPAVFIAAAFALSPFVVIYMVIKVLKDGEYKGGELDSEWGYSDYDANKKS